MVSSGVGRVGLVALLVVVLAGLCVMFGVQSAVPNTQTTPGNDDLAYDYERYVGDVVRVGGTVVGTDPVVIEAEYEFFADGVVHSGTLELTVLELGAEVEVGDELRTYARVQPGNVVVARNAVVVPRWNYLYMYAVSAVAGVWVLGRLAMGWRLDSSLALVRRASPVSVSGLLGGER